MPTKKTPMKSAGSRPMNRSRIGTVRKRVAGAIKKGAAMKASAARKRTKGGTRSIPRTPNPRNKSRY